MVSRTASAMRSVSAAAVVVATGDDPGAAALEAIERLGGIRALLAGRTRAILKPNFVAGRVVGSGATTDLRIVAAVARAVRAAGAEPILCEFPGTEFDQETTFAILGVEELAREHGLRVVRGVERWTALRPAGARALRSFRIPAEVTGAALINLPVLKTHIVSTMSLGIKNLMGLLHLDDRRTMHALGIDRCIVDLARGLRADLTIVDGTVGMDGEGPVYGNPVAVGALVAGTDPLAVDFAACALVGVDPAAVEHLRLAAEAFDASAARRSAAAVAPRAAFTLPRPRRAYKVAFRAMFVLDYPFFALTRMRLARAVYASGLIGTRPKIRKRDCTSCGDCVSACPVPGTIDLSRFAIDPARCVRCLLCVDACGEHAIDVRGLSGAHAAS
jgi:uncharacterized protein (DUF362 family)/ferredoxin